MTRPFSAQDAKRQPNTDDLFCWAGGEHGKGESESKRDRDSRKRKGRVGFLSVAFVPRESRHWDVIWST